MSYPSSIDTGQVQPWMIDQGIGTDATSASGVLAANNVYLFPFELSVGVTITGMRWRMAVTVTGTTDMGIYDASGNLLAHTGVQTNVASNVNSANFASPLNLGPGRYYLALCPSNATDTYFRNAALGAANAIVRAYQGATAGTAGVLPNTTGAISFIQTFPDMAALVSGGSA